MGLAKLDRKGRVAEEIRIFCWFPIYSLRRSLATRACAVPLLPTLSMAADSTNFLAVKSDRRKIRVVVISNWPTGRESHRAN